MGTDSMESGKEIVGLRNLALGEPVRSWQEVGPMAQKNREYEVGSLVYMGFLDC